jgi:rod shape-determining protein MreC
VKKISAKKYLVIAGLFVALLLAHIVGALRPLESLIASTTEPINSVFYSFSVNTKSWIGSFKQPEILQTENQALQEKIAQLQIELNDYQDFALENERLKKSLDYQTTGAWDTVLAKVIGQLETNGQIYLLINKGSSSGLSKNQLVLDENGRLLGDVLEASGNFSKVRLVNHPDFSIGVKKPGSQKPIGILKGNFSVSMLLELIPITTELEIGQAIVTAGLQGKPSNIQAGYISSIDVVPGGLYKTAALELSFDPLDVLFVQVFLSE